MIDSLDIFHARSQFKRMINFYANAFRTTNCLESFSIIKSDISTQNKRQFAMISREQGFIP